MFKQGERFATSSTSVGTEQSVERERRITSVLKAMVCGRRHVNRNISGLTNVLS